jgi:AcrR family transcriptional regulator
MTSAADVRSDPAVRPGLRERSKAKRRALIQRAAMRLFAERGYETTTLIEIADAAEVAPRTVSGYFPLKVDIATSFADEVADRLTATFGAHPDAHVVDVLDAWLRREAEVSDPELAALATAMYETNPQLGVLSSAHVAEAARLGTAAIAAELALPADHPMVEVTNAAVGGALSSYLASMWQRGASPELHQSMIKFLHGVIRAADPS